MRKRNWNNEQANEKLKEYIIFAVSVVATIVSVGIAIVITA